MIMCNPDTVHCSCLLTYQKRVSYLITGGCEPPCGCWDFNSEKQSMLLLAEPSHQPPSYDFYVFPFICLCVHSFIHLFYILAAVSSPSSPPCPTLTNFCPHYPHPFSSKNGNEFPLSLSYYPVLGHPVKAGLGTSSPTEAQQAVQLVHGNKWQTTESETAPTSIVGR